MRPGAKPGRLDAGREGALSGRGASRAGHPPVGEALGRQEDLMRRVLTAATAVTALLLAACANDDSGSVQPAASGSAAAAYPVAVGNVTLTKRPERIVSLAPTATEMLFAIDAGPQVVAVDDQSTYPADAPRTDLSGF